MPTKQHQTFSESDKAAWRAAKQQRLADLGEQLKTQVASVQDSDAFKRYLANHLAGHPAEQAPTRAQLTMAHIRISTALRSIQDAERSLRLAGHASDLITPLDAAV